GARQPPPPPRARLRAGDRPPPGGLGLGDPALRSVSLCYHQRRRAPGQRRAGGDHPGEASSPGAHARPGPQHSERLPGQDFLLRIPRRRRSRPARRRAFPMADKMDDKDEKADVKVDSKFRFVLVAAQRAEQLMRGARPKVEAGKRKPTRVAMQEGRANLIDWGYGPAPEPEPHPRAEAQETTAEGPQAEGRAPEEDPPGRARR